MSIPKQFPGETAIIAGTGPSLTPEDIELCNQARQAGVVRILSANRAHELFDTDVFHACNWQFYNEYYDLLKDKPCDKWTTRPELKNKYEGVKYIEERWADGLSKDPSYIHAHHGTGPQLVNIAYLYGCTRLILIGWDMRYPGKLDDTNKNYSEPRHFFGEDVLTERHWSRTDAQGRKFGLIREMETIKP